MIGIYKITSPSKKIYIGQSINVNKRLKEYKYLSNCKTQPKLYNSLVKYGFSQHIFEIIEQCSVEELNVRERYWQEFHNTIGERGLNCRLTETGDKSGRMSQEFIQNCWKPVVQYSPKGILIKEWRSVKEAGETLNIFRTSISKCVKGKGKSAGGFIWKYADENLILNLNDHKPKLTKAKEDTTHNRRIVFCKLGSRRAILEGRKQRKLFKKQSA